MTELVGIDVGGTFTDFIFLRDGEVHVHKEPTTPRDQSIAIGEGIAKLGVSQDAFIIHGTTTATNALLERRGSKTALLTTEGFADILQIGRQNRPKLYELTQRRPTPLVPRARRLTIKERISADGVVLEPIEEMDLHSVARMLEDEQVESVAIVFLFSFLNDTHERKAHQFLSSSLPSVFFSVSVDILPEYREFERTATTVINAYVQPLVGRYLDRLTDVADKRPVWVMQSNGGTITTSQASQQPARLVLSGPAGGVVGAYNIAQKALDTPTPLVMTLDMGGTSTDVSLCPGSIPRTSENSIGDLPLRLPSIHIHTVGAGGGSIARKDIGGALRVGPQSAGAEPGPICYFRGGTAPTVTDANLILGRLDGQRFSGNRPVPINQIRQALAVLGSTPEEAALGVIRVANATMERALRRVSVEKGYDPRNYTLIPFGGAGPLHACDLAEALGMNRIVVPRYPGVLSALGLMMADITYDASKAMVVPLTTLEENPAPLQSSVVALTQQVAGALDGEPLISATLDLRYLGQSYEIEVPLKLPVMVENLVASADAFHQAHRQRYGHNAPHQPVQCVAVRIRGVIPGSQPRLPESDESERNSKEAISGSREVWLDNHGPQPVDIYNRSRLLPGHHFQGPALIFQYESTLLVTNHWNVKIDRHLNAIMEYATPQA